MRKSHARKSYASIVAVALALSGTAALAAPQEGKKGTGLPVPRFVS